MNNSSVTSWNANKIWRALGLLVFIFFEVYAGIRLLSDPVDFTNSVIVFFGIIMLIVGVVSLIRALKMKSGGLPYTMTLVGAILDLVIGIICVAFSKNVVSLFPILAMFYGVAMVIFGVNKIRQYAVLKDLQVPRAWILLVSGILTIILGVIVFLHPFSTTELIWMWAGIFLIAEGVCDLFALIFSFFM